MDAKKIQKSLEEEKEKLFDDVQSKLSKSPLKAFKGELI